MVPGRMRWLAMLCSNSSAKLSVMFSLKKLLFPGTDPVCQWGYQKTTAVTPCAAAYQTISKRQTSSNDSQDALDHRIDGHTGCIQQDGVCACDKRRNGACNIALIAFRYLFRKGGKGSSNPLFFQLLIASGRAFVGACRAKNLDPCVRKYDGAHVAPVGHQTRGHRKAPLPLQQSLADRRQRSNLGRITAGGLGANVASDLLPPQINDFLSRGRGIEANVEFSGEAPQPHGVVQIDSRNPAGQRHQPVQRTAIEQSPSQPLCCSAANRALSRPGRAVDGQDGRVQHGS